MSLYLSKIHALAHRRMAFSVLRINSSLATRLKSYNDQMSIAPTSEVQGGAE